MNNEEAGNGHVQLAEIYGPFKFEHWRKSGCAEM